jgi:23S rRNA pseudouridine2604 synthase
MTESTRLAKRIAELAACSRREAEQYIEGGWVKVNGQVVEEPGFKVQLADVLDIASDADLQPIEPVTMLLHYQSGSIMATASHIAEECISAETRSPEDRSSIRFLKRHLANLTLTCPLEPNASGLVVLTQDWHIARKLVDDAAKIEQEYIVEVSGEMVPNGLQLLQHGLNFNGRPLAPIKVSWQNETRLRFALKDLQRGQIAHMCSKVGLNVISLKRIRISRIPMANLALGQWRYLQGYERF